MKKKKNKLVVWDQMWKSRGCSLEKLSLGSFEGAAGGYF